MMGGMAETYMWKQLVNTLFTDSHLSLTFSHTIARIKMPSVYIHLRQEHEFPELRLICNTSDPYQANSLKHE